MATAKQKQHVPVFVSSTYKDLQPHRAEVERVLVGMEQIVKGMEFFGSNPDTPLDVCLQHISECKLFILVLGVSYGSVANGMEKSFTELEYEYAVDNNIPVLAYLADTRSTKIGIPIDSYDVENAKRLINFKEKVTQRHTVSFFTSIDDLGKRIEHDVPSVLSNIDNIEVKVSDVDINVNLTEEMLRQGSEKFQRFWLRPAKLSGDVVPLRLRINTKWNGWKVKDELIRALGLEVGDTISTEITPMLSDEIIDHGDDTDLFAAGEAADWLLENAPKAGSVIDCFVRFSYCKAPIGADDKVVNKVSLILVKGIQYVSHDPGYDADAAQNAKLRQLFQRLGRP